MRTKTILAMMALLVFLATALPAAAAEVKTQQVETVTAVGVMEKYIRMAGVNMCSRVIPFTWPTVDWHAS